MLQLVVTSKMPHRTRITCYQDKIQLRCCQAICRALLAIESDLPQIVFASLPQGNHEAQQGGGPRSKAISLSETSSHLVAQHCMTAGAADWCRPWMYSAIESGVEFFFPSDLSRNIGLPRALSAKSFLIGTSGSLSTLPPGRPARNNPWVNLGS